jgi:hypothetical protein
MESYFPERSLEALEVMLPENFPDPPFPDQFVYGVNSRDNLFIAVMGKAEMY